MPFTAQELENIVNTTLAFHMKGEVHKQTIQEKPLLAALNKRKKSFGGGAGKEITDRVKGDYTTTIQGYSGDDTVTYGNPANVKKVSVVWKEIHAGIQVTHTELKEGGIGVVDSMTGAKTAEKSDSEKFRLANLLADKLEDMSEGSARGLNLMFWRDGTQDADLVPGIRYFIRNDPTAAVVVAGIDQSAVSWWRNRASLAITASTASDQNVINKLQTEYRQLTRYGGKPDLWLAGSDMMTWIEKEMKSSGYYTDGGWAKSGAIDMSVGDLVFKGHHIKYDPTLDDESLAKYLFLIDTKGIYPMSMEGEDGKQHTPARPENKYVLYRATTWTMAMMARRRNSSGVYSIA